MHPRVGVKAFVNPLPAQAEVERFVQRPFLMGTREDTNPDPPPPADGGDPERAERSSRLSSRKTTSIFVPAQ